MECTQRLECTQELYCTQTQNEKLFPEQIGFLGICGTKHPVKKGPNKIGRDPQTCNIVLNLHSVSRQHAVINILNKKDFMLMDLDSANKTKLSGQTLKPYIPLPLHNGDTIQFGEIFGIFRLLEEETDLPMTQAMDIPDTPVPIKQLSRVNAYTTIPESPDVSDKDESFIIPSQPKAPLFQSLKIRNFVKPGKTISIQPVGTNKIDNVYWNSSKKSTSLNLDDSTISLNDSIPSAKLNGKEDESSNDIHELETQEVFPPQKMHNDDTDSIFTANTQLPNLDNAGQSIFNANTDLPDAINSPSIHSLETQLPSIHNLNTQMPGALGSPSVHGLDKKLPPNNNLPEICKISKQQDMQIDFYANKENDDSIYNAETQIVPVKKDNVLTVSNNSNESCSRMISNNKLNTSNDVVLFDELDNQQFEDFGSQPIITEDIDLPINRLVEPELKTESQSQIMKPKSAKRNMRIKSDSSTDCEDIDILPTQKIVPIKVDDDSTDCEEDIQELKVNNTKNSNVSLKAIENVEEIATQVIMFNEEPPNKIKDVSFEDMPTQVIEINDIEKDANIEKDKLNTDMNIEDLPTQVIGEDLRIQGQNCSNRLAGDNDVSPFKLPFNASLKGKKKGFTTPKIKLITNINSSSSSNSGNKYYQDTQDIYDDLCTQKLEFVKTDVGDIVDGVNHKSPRSDISLDLGTSFNSVDAEEKVNDFVSNLSSQDVRAVIGVETQICTVKKNPSDGSTDTEITPKKLRPFKFMEIDLPNSQEIKSTVSMSTRSLVTESSSESETEFNTEEQCTPILFRKKIKPKQVKKLDLTEKFNVEALPSRVITRVRKPTAKIKDLESSKGSENILKPTFMNYQESDIDNEIITENITRIKNKTVKLKNAKCNEKELKQNITSEAPIQVESNIEVRQPDLNVKNKQDTKEVVSVKESDISKELKQAGFCKKNESIQGPKQLKLNKDTQQTASSKEVPRINIAEENIADKVKKERYSRKKPEKEKEKARNPTDEIKTSNNEDKIKKSEPKTRKLENKEPLNNISNDCTKQSHNSGNDTVTAGLSKSPVEQKRRTRSSRIAKTTNTSKPQIPQEVDLTRKSSKQKYTKKQESKEYQNEKETSPEKEVRRSKRQKIVKETEEEPVKVPKSILKKSITVSHEESAVYNLSSGSNSDTSRLLKRPALDDNEESCPKRTRSMVSSNTSMRATPSKMLKTQYVLFTAFPYEAVKAKLENLGAVVVTDLMKSTVLLTRQIKRTFKLLCAVGLGKPIVGPTWVQACADSNTIVDPWLYLMKDETAEKRFHFSLERTLKGRRKFLNGYNVSSTPKVMPEAHEMKLIVECSGGTWKEGGRKWICVTVPDDAALWPALRSRGAELVSTEFILGGVLRQRVDIDAAKYKIS